METYTFVFYFSLDCTWSQTLGATTSSCRRSFEPCVFAEGRNTNFQRSKGEIMSPQQPISQSQKLQERAL